MQSLTAGGGLQNLGNTCFFNATLQSLLHTPPLARLFQNHLHSQHCHSHQWCVFCQMESIYSKTRQTRCFAPNSMIVNLKKVFKKFKLGRQEDSHEFLRYLVQGMQESETGKLGKDRQENERKIRKTKMFGCFGGVIKTCVQCLSCNHKSITDERYYDFNISQECQRANSLIEGVSSFFAIDRLEGANKYLCERCKLRSNARKGFVLESIPEVATFQLKRFTNNMRKIGKFIQYPLEIDLGKYLQHPRKVVLKLFAIIVHAGGSSFSGHYYAFVRVANAWYKMDDSYVSKCNVQTVMNQQAYILFYEREDRGQTREVNGLRKQSDKIEIQIVTKNQTKNDQKQALKQMSSLNNHKQFIKVIQTQKLQLNHANHTATQNGANQYELVKKLNNLAIGKSSPDENLVDKDLTQIQQILIQKLTSADVFKGINQQKIINSAIQKAVKQAIHHISPKKAVEERKVDQLQNQELVLLPTLQRRKSKQQMQNEMPYAQLVLRTFETIMELKSKMPAQKPHNFSHRSMYNLRKYETTMQKKRKLG